MSCAKESEPLPASLSHLQISAIEVEPPPWYFGEGVRQVTEVQHPGRRRRTGRSKRGVDELQAMRESSAD
jgi:hypothetical protein